MLVRKPLILFVLSQSVLTDVQPIVMEQKQRKAIEGNRKLANLEQIIILKLWREESDSLSKDTKIEF